MPPFLVREFIRTLLISVADRPFIDEESKGIEIF